MNSDLIANQKEYEASMLRHRLRLEAKARALHKLAKITQRKLTYEEIWNYVQDNDESDHGCEPSPIEWERLTIIK